VYLELAGVDGLFHVDACASEPREMIFLSLRVDEVESLIALVEAVLDERVQHAVLLVDAVEERANMTKRGESVRRNPQRIVLGFHTLPPPGESRFCPGTSGRYGDRPFERVTSRRIARVAQNQHVPCRSRHLT
jgi:hypothetical protein